MARQAFHVAPQFFQAAPQFSDTLAQLIQLGGHAFGRRARLAGHPLQASAHGFGLSGEVLGRLMQAGGVQVLDGRLQMPETLPQFGRFRRPVGQTAGARSRSWPYLAFFTFDALAARRSLPSELSRALLEPGGLVLPACRLQFLDFSAQALQFAPEVVAFPVAWPRGKRLDIATALG